ncbi:unnamed protein product, partial [Candidula unifasciata]
DQTVNHWLCQMRMLPLACYGHNVFNRSLHYDIFPGRSHTLNDYRCPVSTPASDTRGPDDIKRSKTLHVINLQ